MNDYTLLTILGILLYGVGLFSGIILTTTFMQAEAIPEANIQYQANITVRPDIEVILYPNITLNATFYPAINPNVSVTPNVSINLTPEIYFEPEIKFNPTIVARSN